MEDLVSIIVPVYNVEKYLRKCVESILRQTFKNLEIILVDDGSQDSSSRMCDQFAEVDKRIKVIHKENGGASEARNVGVECAKGNYLVFVDSDDWITDTMVERLLETCKEFNVKLSTCARYTTVGEKIVSECFEGERKKFSAAQALNEILLGRSMDVSPCDKICHRSLYNGIKYPVGETNEDAAVFYKLIDRAQIVVHCGTTEYYYRSRPSSVTKLEYSISARRIIEKNLNNIEAFIKTSYPSCINAFLRYKVVNIYRLLNNYIKCRGADKTEEYRHLMLLFKENKKVFFKDDKTDIKEKLIAIMILLGTYSPYLDMKKRITGNK